MVDWLWKAKTVKKLSCISVWEKEGNGNNTFCFRIHGHRGSTQASEVEARICHQMQRDSSCSCSISLTLFSSHKALELHTQILASTASVPVSQKSWIGPIQHDLLLFLSGSCNNQQKKNMHWNNNNNNNGHAKKQQHWTTRKSTQVWWSRIGHIIRMKELGYLCVRARARIYQMHERNATKKEENRWKKSKGAICEEEEEEERNIWQKDIWARDTLHYPYPWEKVHTGSLMAWTDAIQELARSCEILVLADASNIPGRASLECREWWSREK